MFLSIQVLAETCTILSTDRNIHILYSSEEGVYQLTLYKVEAQCVFSLGSMLTS